ncbi:MAG: S-methyl-5'-thioinosine phosphorylase [Gammaproteobacteria bacterium]|nr:MAG: S-methyl-5'-thioinosine phosphorylase [Gammaproteobacteria bacterium]
MADLAIIGGTGLTTLKNLEITRREVMRTPYGEPSGPLLYGKLCHQDVIFIPRHGRGHTIPPHMVNYRANIWALREAGVRNVIAVAAVGGIHEDMQPGRLAIPDQIIDYTWSRRHTYFESELSEVTHTDFTRPYSEEIRNLLITSAQELDLQAVEDGVYAATQGPRLETAAEIDRLERDGCSIVGMTGMPEAALARELGLEYAHCAVIANRAAGRGTATISMADIEQNLASGMERVRRLLETAIPNLCSKIACGATDRA